MTTCHCGSHDFIVEEVLQHAADTTQNGQLIVHDRDIANDLSRVFCAKCRVEHSFADFDCSELFSCE
jgi:hypothetical protein